MTAAQQDKQGTWQHEFTNYYEALESEPVDQTVTNFESLLVDIYNACVRLNNRLRIAGRLRAQSSTRAMNKKGR